MRASRDSGFVLFEVLVSIVILSAGCVALVKSLSMSLRTFGALEDRYLAALALEDAAWTMDRSGGVFDPLQYQGEGWSLRRGNVDVGGTRLEEKTLTIEKGSFSLSSYYRTDANTD